MSSVPLNIGQNLEGSLVPPQQGDGSGGGVKDEELNEFVSCQVTLSCSAGYLIRQYGSIGPVWAQNGPYTIWLLLHFSQHQVSFVAYTLQT